MGQFNITSAVKPPHSKGYKKDACIPSHHKQQGVALLTVLLLVVAITVVAGSMMASQRLSLRQYELLVTQDTLLQNVRAAEDLAATLIAADAKVNDHDGLQDAWAQPVMTTALNGYDIHLTIKDASARFNINNLYHDGQVDEEALEVFQRLLSQLGIEPNLAYAVLDWQDADAQAFDQDSLESEIYLGQGGSQSADNHLPNQPFLSVQQLSLVTGFTPEIMAALQPYVIAMPYYLPINVNTAKPIVLSALVEGSRPEQFEPWVVARQTAPADKVSDLLQQPPWSSIETGQKGVSQGMIDSRSHGFYVLIDVMVQQRDQVQHRYATTFVSKTEHDAKAFGNNSADPSSAAGSEVAADSEDTATSLIIQPFGTRLWTYRPAF